MSLNSKILKFFKDMDDFNGKFCNNGSYPIIRSVSDCFKESSRLTATTSTTSTTTKKRKTTTEDPIFSTTQIIYDDKYDDYYNGDYNDPNKKNSAHTMHSCLFFNLYFTLYSIYFFLDKLIKKS
jgi:hypothetical protein